MTLQDIFIYPVKSLGGISLTSAQALQRGFQFDRRWMLVDENGRCITQRDEPSLALLQTCITTTGILISNKKNHEQQCFILKEPDVNKKIAVSVWDDRVEGYELNENAAEWLSQYLQRPCKLIYMPEDSIRPVDQQYAENNEQVSFADAFPYLLISQATLDDLNSRLEIPIAMNRFRPNLVVRGAEGYAEDSWAEIKINDVHFKVAKPCARCIVTTINQETTEKAKEPLLTLSKYRSLNNKVLFGQNLLALNAGKINVNSKIEVLKYK
ncbi:MAG: MOSC domain-containing protein [Pyrinomonadaceae bacterium]|nr:MOSC domain-containing protein [Sphingobacteriaceae bacterium]